MTAEARRQHALVCVHIDRAYGRFAPYLNRATTELPISGVDIVDGLRIQTADPSVFRELAVLFTRGADSLDTVIRAGWDVEAAADAVREAAFTAQQEAS